MLVLAYLSLASAPHWPGDIASLWGMLMTTWVGHTTSVLWLEDHSKLTHGKRFGGGRKNESLTHASWLWDNPRLIGTVRAESIIYPDTNVDLYHWSYKRLGRLAGLSIWLVNQHHVFPGPGDFSPVRETFIRRLAFSSSTQVPVTLRETALRGMIAVWWAINAYVGLTIAHIVLSIIFVLLLRTDRQADWPPIFGSISEAYSIRRFWSKFWHRIVVRPYTNHALFVSRKLFWIRPNSSAERLMIVFMIFAFSGISQACLHR